MHRQGMSRCDKEASMKKSWRVRYRIAQWTAALLVGTLASLLGTHPAHCEHAHDHSERIKHPDPQYHHHARPFAHPNYHP